MRERLGRSTEVFAMTFLLYAQGGIIIKSLARYKTAATTTAVAAGVAAVAGQGQDVQVDDTETLQRIRFL